MRILTARHFLGLRRPIPSATGGNLRRQERLYCQIQFEDGIRGYGESAPHPVYGPALDGIEEQIRGVRDYFRTANLPETLFISILDVWARSASLPVWDALGWPKPPADGHRTLLTYGGTDPERICSEIAEESAGPVKLKLTGAPSDLIVAREVWQAFRQPLVLDINGAWRWDEAIRNLRILEAEHVGILWIEQPCRPTVLREKLPTTLPIFADEALDDPAFDWNCYDGVVLKPARMGLLACARIGRLAKELGKAVTIGCHLQSSLLTSASLCLGGFVSEPWIDLDSALLVKDDPFESPPINEATRQIRLSEGNGLATKPIIDLEWQS